MQAMTKGEAKALPLETVVWLEETTAGGQACPAVPVEVLVNDPDEAMVRGHGYPGTEWLAWDAYNRRCGGWRLWISEPSKSEVLKAARRWNA